MNSYPINIPEASSLCLIYEHETIWLLKHKNQIPDYAALPDEIRQQKKFYPLGSLREASYFFRLKDEKIKLPDSFKKITLVELLATVSPAQRNLIDLGYHFFQWEANSRFCGRCGFKTNFVKARQGKRCSNCSFTVYPLISPCVIVAVIRDKTSILLAEINHQELNFQSVLAGFVEMGESLEQAVIREVREEVGIKIKNLKYYGSQAWALSQSLLIAYMADYDDGEILVDGHEVQYAAWYRFDNLPELPPKFSIARKMIDFFRKNNT